MKPYHLQKIHLGQDDNNKSVEWLAPSGDNTFIPDMDGTYRINNGVTYKYAFFYVNAVDDDFIVLSISSSQLYRLWINRNFSGISPEKNGIMVGKIQKGDNLILIKFLEPVTTLSFSCRVSFGKYETQPYPTRLLHNNLYIEYMRFTIDIVKIQWGPSGEICFLLALNNGWNIDEHQQIKVQLLPYWHNVVLTEANVIPNQKSSLVFPENMTRNVYTLRATYKLLDGKERTKDFYLYPPNLCTVKNETIATIQKLLEVSSCTNYTKLVFNYLINECYETFTEDTMAQMLRCLDYVNENGSLDSLIYRAGNIDRFFISSLDGKPEKYHVSIPQNYDPNKKYALYITIATYRYGQDSDVLFQCDQENVIWADISCRGYTLGSYIGEAAALEAIQNICETYNVDKTRIYLSGSSNGGACAWVLAKAYPHMFAGIKIVSGHVELADLGNLNNMRVINISSKYENMYAASFENPQKILQENENYDGYLAEEMNHSDLMKIRFQQDLINELLVRMTNPYPEHIKMYSSRYIHGHCYWLKIHDGVDNKSDVNIEAIILNEKTIDIYEENVATFEVFLPDIIKSRNFSVIINHVPYEFREYNRSSIVFNKQKESGSFTICDEPQENQSRRGIGLLNVFFHPLLVYCDMDDSLSRKVADVISTPCGNGYDPHIFINYPIIDVKTLQNCSTIRYGIVIDNNLELVPMKNIRANAVVHTDKQGFVYQGKQFLGPYVVIQLVKGHSHNRDVLYINTNDNKLYKKILFFRRFVMPSYINGFHPYLNNEALIYYNGQYYVIGSYGMPMNLTSGDKLSKKEIITNHSTTNDSCQTFNCQNLLDLQNGWILSENGNQLKNGYLIKNGVFIPLSGKYACLADNIIPSDVPYTLTATVRAYDKVGISVEMGDDGKGYAILFLSENGKKCVDFLNDDCVWGKHPHVNGQSFDYYWDDGTWYKIKLEASVSDNELRAKIWIENEEEPRDWMFTAELTRMAAIYRYGTKFVRKGKPGIRFLISENTTPLFKEILIAPQETT